MGSTAVLRADTKRESQAGGPGFPQAVVDQNLLLSGEELVQHGCFHCGALPLRRLAGNRAELLNCKVEHTRTAGPPRGVTAFRRLVTAWDKKHRQGRVKTRAGARDAEQSVLAHTYYSAKKSKEAGHHLHVSNTEDLPSELPPARLLASQPARGGKVTRRPCVWWVTDEVCTEKERWGKVQPEPGPEEPGGEGSGL